MIRITLVLVVFAIFALSANAGTVQPIRPYPVSEHGTKLLANTGHRLVPFPVSEHRARLHPRPISEH